MKLNSNFLKAISVLVGTIIGAGIFSLPYAFAQAGYLVGLIYLFVIAVIFYLTYLCYAEVILRTEESLEMAGYVAKYLGKKGKIIITLSLVLGIYCALIAYIIGVGKFLHALISPFLGGKEFIYSIFFWLVASGIIFKGIRTMAALELVLTAGLIFVVIFIFYLTYPYLDLANLKGINFKNLFFPYGPVLFALGGASALPTMRKILDKEVNFFKKSILMGLAIPVFVYLIFSFSIVGVTGKNTSEEGIIGLSQIVDSKILLIGSIFGIFTMATSFLALGYVLQELFYKDYQIPHLGAWILSTFIPLILFILGLRNFIQVISFSGGILSGLQGMLLIESFYQAKIKGNRKPELSFNLPRPLSYFIYLIYFLGIFYQIIYFIP